MILVFLLGLIIACLGLIEVTRRHSKWALVAYFVGVAIVFCVLLSVAHATEGL